MMNYRRCAAVLEEYTPHLVMTLAYLFTAILIVLLQSVISGGDSGIVFVLYEHLISAILLSALALFFERGKRPPLTFYIACWAFFLGFLQITLFQVLITYSLGYISATFESTALNTITAVVFVLAVIFRQEAFNFCTANGQAKLWGIALSLLGSAVSLLYPGPQLLGLASVNIKQILGGCMVVCGILATAVWNILVERVIPKYPATLSLSAMMIFFGTLQVAVIAILTERKASSWHLSFNLELLGILNGGIVVTGLGYYAQTWCIQKRGPVFTTAFTPLLIVFSYIMEVILGKAVHLWSVVGSILVVLGLYLILWAKDGEKKKTEEESTVYSPLISPDIEP